MISAQIGKSIPAPPGTKPETLDWAKTTVWVTPTASYADYTSISELPKVRLTESSRTEMHGQDAVTRVTLVNPSKSLASFVRLKVERAEGREILPALWEDNYLSLLPGEKREITATYRAKGLGSAKPVAEVSGWNAE